MANLDPNPVFATLNPAQGGAGSERQAAGKSGPVRDGSVVKQAGGQPEKPRLVDVAIEKVLEWDAKVTAEKRRGKFAIELTYDESGAVLLRELIDLTTK